MPQDILLAENFDLLIKDGDLVIGESTRQHQKLLLLANKGEIREFPQRGVGIERWIDDDFSVSLHSAIKREFEADGMTVDLVRGDLGDLQIEAEYE